MVSEIQNWNRKAYQAKIIKRISILSQEQAQINSFLKTNS